MFVDLWGWFHDFEYSAYRLGDGERLQLLRLYDQAWHNFETDPSHALILLNQGVELAQRLNEPCFALFMDYWRCEVHLFYLDDHRLALENAVRLVTESRKPQFLKCPVRARVHRILVDTYLFTDPIGYSDQIWQTINYMETDMSLDIDSWQLLQARRAQMAYAVDDLDTAIAETRKYSSICQGNDFRLSHACGMLCHYHYLKNDVETARHFATLGETHARRSDRLASAAEFTTWQALFARLNGDAEQAHMLYSLSQQRFKKLGVKPSGGFYQAAADYFDLEGQVDEAVRLRRQELQEAKDSGSVWYECDTWVKLCRLLAKHQRLLAADLQAARQAATKLLKPEIILKKLDELPSTTG